MEGNNKFTARAREFLRTKGFYLVLSGCLATVGAAALLVLTPAAEEEHTPAGQSDDQRLEEVLQATPSPTPRPTSSAIAEGALEGIPSAKPTPSPQEIALPDDDIAIEQSDGLEDSAEDVSDAEETATLPEDDLLFCPVEGEVLLGFAGDTLVYSKTLDQWTSHSGVDLSAPVGTPVLAVADGVVTLCENDPMMGYSITLEHEGGMKTVYANLDQLPAFEKGDTIRAGTEVGAVGATAIAESAEEPHLHFELHLDGKAVDPVPHVRSLSSIPLK